MLARLLRAHPDALRADFQRYYGLNLDGMGRDYSVAHAADLAANLPNGCRCSVAENPLCEWSLETVLLALIEHHLAIWNFAHRKDKNPADEQPKLLIPRPSEGEADERPDTAVAMTEEEMSEFISGLMGRRSENG